MRRELELLETRFKLGAADGSQDAADHALALDPDLPETHLALGYFHYYGQRGFHRGTRGIPAKLKRAFPITLMSSMRSPLSQRRLGHWEEALGGLRRVVELDPRYH